MTKTVSMSKNEEKILINKALEGDDKAFIQLIGDEKNPSSILSRLHNATFGKLKDDPDRAEEVISDLFFEIYKSLKNFRQESSLYTFCYTIFERRLKKELKTLAIEKKRFISSSVIDSEGNIEDVFGKIDNNTAINASSKIESISKATKNSDEHKDEGELISNKQVNVPKDVFSNQIDDALNDDPSFYTRELDAVKILRDEFIKEFGTEFGDEVFLALYNGHRRNEVSKMIGMPNSTFSETLSRVQKKFRKIIYQV